jgi:hypothetical protein
VAKACLTVTDADCSWAWQSNVSMRLDGMRAVIILVPRSRPCFAGVVLSRGQYEMCEPKRT